MPKTDQQLSHEICVLQWRANSNYNGLNNYELAKADWGWSWVERWIAAWPWESCVSITSTSPKKVNSKQASKVTKYSSPLSGKAPVPVKGSLSNGKRTTTARKLSFPDTEKPGVQKGAKDEEMNNKKEKEADNMV